MCKKVNEGEKSFLLADADSRVSLSLSILLKQGQIRFISYFSRVPEEVNKDGRLQ